MIRALFTASTGMIAQQFLVDSTANNLANANTNGYKRSEVEFQDLFYLTLRQPGGEILAAGGQNPTGLQLGNGVRVAGNTKVFTEGTLSNTGNPLDVAIQGEGFFQINFPDGTLRFTRDGAFRLNSTGQLVNADGFLLTPAITIPPETTQIVIGTDGTVSAVTPGSVTAVTVGTIQLARFANPAGLSAEGRNLFRETAASGAPTLQQPGQGGAGLLQQGFLELSNVDVVQELINLILAQRVYEFNTRAVRVSDQMLAATVELVR